MGSLWTQSNLAGSDDTVKHWLLLSNALRVESQTLFEILVPQGLVPKVYKLYPLNRRNATLLLTVLRGRLP